VRHDQYSIYVHIGIYEPLFVCNSRAPVGYCGA